jgi:hypothetical protein
MVPHLFAFQFGLLQFHLPIPIDRPRLVELILERNVILGHLVECREQFVALVLHNSHRGERGGGEGDGLSFFIGACACGIRSRERGRVSGGKAGRRLLVMPNATYIPPPLLPSSSSHPSLAR